MNNYEEMRIESDVFATARENFDLLMQRLFKSMEKNNSDEGSITLKVDLQMSQDWVPDGKGGSIEINKPVIKHKVSIAVPVKDSMDGKKDAGMNLVWDEELKRYVLKYINEGGQQSLFDPDYEENLKAGADLDESTMLPGPSNALPEDNGVIDAEFKEVNQSEEAENQADTPADEEITDQEETNAPGGDTEATDSTDDNGDYEYEDPEEGMIIFVRMKSGKSMPVNPNFVNFRRDGGKDRIVLANGEVTSGTIVTDPGEAQGFGYVSHFATCEYAQTFRRK